MMPQPRLPPGQFVTEKFPVLHAGTVPDTPKEAWTLHIAGELDRPLTLTYTEFRQLPRTSVTCDVHCVTSWSKFQTRWEGIRFRDLVAVARPRPNARFAIFDCEQGHTTSLSLSELMGDNILLADTYDGRDLEPEHGGPVRAVVPHKYFYKSAKWVRGIRLSQEDEPGFWEVRGYSNIADPWTEDRYVRLSWQDIVQMRMREIRSRRQPAPTSA